MEAVATRTALSGRASDDLAARTATIGCLTPESKRWSGCQNHPIYLRLDAPLYSEGAWGPTASGGVIARLTVAEARGIVNALLDAIAAARDQGVGNE